MSKLNSTFGKEQIKEGDSSVSLTMSPISQESPPNFVTERNRGDLQLRNDFKIFQETIMATLEGWFARQDEKQAIILREFEDIKKSITFMADKYEELTKKSDDTLKRVVDLEKRYTQTDQNAKRIVELENKINGMEQQARQCNLEISNLPERRGENLVAIVTEIGTVVKQPITPQDLVSVTRVQRADTSNKRPKNVIVKLSSRVLRDNFVSSVRLAKGITTEQLKISGPLQNIYINEHLTLRNKQLFREARVAAKDQGYKYTWIKHGVILVSEKETAPVFAVRDQEDLLKLKRNKSN